MRWRLLIGGVFATIWGGLQGQTDFATDRPSESAAASLVPEGTTLAELGGTMNWNTAESGVVEFSYAAPLGIIRYGLGEVFELRAGAQFNQQVGNVDNALIGAKVRLPGAFWGGFEGCWLVELNVNPSARWTPGTSIPMQHRLCVGTDIGHNAAVTANAGWFREAGTNTWMGSAALSRELGMQGWTGFVEPFWQSDAGWRANLGFQRSLPRNMQMDIVYGRNFGATARDVRVGLGLSLLLDSTP